MANHTSSNNLYFLTFFIDRCCREIAFLLIHFNNKITLCGEGDEFCGKVRALVFGNLIESVSEKH
jgi:hypothetical protein